jgi:hypothetical protein
MFVWIDNLLISEIRGFDESGLFGVFGQSIRV